MCTMDLISREDAIRWVKTECNPYGKPTLDFESGKKVIEHLEQMPSAQPDIIRCKDCKYARLTNDGSCKYCDIWFPDEAEYMDGDYYCASAERKSYG